MKLETVALSTIIIFPRKEETYGKQIGAKILSILTQLAGSLIASQGAVKFLHFD